MNKYDYLIKIMMIGDSSVGKSCMLTRYSDDTFSTSYISTVGIDFKVRTLNLENKVIKLQIWDTAGQERFRNIVSAYYRGTMGAIIVYDVTNLSSFKSIDYWLQSISKNGDANLVKVLVGNKCDYIEKDTVTDTVTDTINHDIDGRYDGRYDKRCDGRCRQVTYQMGKELADQLRIPFFETSAKLNKNISIIFDTIATLALLNQKLLPTNINNIKNIKNIDKNENIKKNEKNENTENIIVLNKDNHKNSCSC